MNLEWIWWTDDPLNRIRNYRADEGTYVEIAERGRMEKSIRIGHCRNSKKCKNHI